MEWISDLAIDFSGVDPGEFAHPSEVAAGDVSIFGVVVDGKARAYLGSIVTREGGTLEDTIGGVTIRLAYDTDTGTFSWEVPDGVRVDEAYWLAWKAFHPATEIWRDELPPSD